MTATVPSGRSQSEELPGHRGRSGHLTITDPSPSVPSVTGVTFIPTLHAELMTLASRHAEPAHPALSLAESAVLISRALEVAGRLANDAAEVITATAGRENGSGPDPSYDWVTDTDRTLERHTRRVLTAEFAGVPVLGEEYGGPDGFDTALPGSLGADELLWIVDPLDGSANFRNGLPWCGYSLALVDSRGPLVGVVADPYRAQLYAAARGRGLRANGRPVEQAAAMGGSDSLAGRLVFIEDSPGRPRDQPEGDPVLVPQPAESVGAAPWVSDWADACRRAGAGVRMLGSPALAITQVALGRAAAAVIRGHRVWDVAGALALADQAGCRITDLAGQQVPLPLDGLLVADPRVADTVLAVNAAIMSGGSADDPGRAAP